MTPDSSCRTRWSSVCSFFSSSFWKSSICRAASRRLRSNYSCRSRRASGVISAPFFSSSSRSFSSSWRLPSISRCITAFSRSSCSRAATPAEDRASTRCTSIYAIRIADPEAGAGDGVGPGAWATTGDTATPRSTVTTMIALLHFFIQPLLERRADREVKRPDRLTRSPVKIETVVHADRAERRLPSYTSARRLAQVRGIEFGAESVDVADVEEARQPEGKRQGDDVLDVAEYFARSAGLEPELVHRREAVEFEAADRVRTAEEEALEERQRFVRPAESVSSLRPHRDDVAEPDRLEVGLKRRRLDELRVAAKPGEVQAEHRLRALRRCGDHIAAVAGQ